MLLQIVLGGLIAVMIYVYVQYKKSSNNLYIGQKIYYFIYDKNKKYSGRINAIITCYREEDITNPGSALRIIAFSERKIRNTKSILVEIQPILGGQKLVLPVEHIFHDVNTTI